MPDLDIPLPAEGTPDAPLALVCTNPTLAAIPVLAIALLIGAAVSGIDPNEGPRR